MGQSGGYKNESGTLKCPTTTTTTACQVKWAPQMSGASLFQCLRLRSPTRSLMRPHSEDIFGRGNILLFKSSCRDTERLRPVTPTPQSVCVCVGVCFMLVKCQQCRTHEFAPETRTKLWKTAATNAARPDTYYCFVYIYIYTRMCACICVGVYIYFDKFIWQVVNEMPGWLTRRAQYFSWCGSFINIFDVITHVSDIWQCPTKVWHPIQCVG